MWDHLHGRPPSRLSGDVDVVWFCPERAGPEDDREVEAALRALDPAVDWSMKNQARMHLRNGDAPYASAVEAIGHWPETATAVAARLTAGGCCEIAAPFGLGDLFDLLLRPTLRFAGEKRGVYLDRIQSKTVAGGLAAAADRRVMFSLEHSARAFPESRPVRER